MSRILFVEDDQRVGDEISRFLAGADFDVKLATDLVEARLALRGPIDLLLLDLGLPDGDGLDLCREIRRGGSSLPILMLTARDAPEARVRGFEWGADDYLTKPCHLPELLLRIRALLRRTQPSAVDSVPRIGNLALDEARREVRLGERLLSFRKREFDLLAFLMKNPDRPWTRAQLLDRVWGEGADVTARTVDIHVRRIRQQIEERPATPKFLRTEFGVGYVMRSSE